MDNLPDLILALADQHPQLVEHFPYVLVFALLYLSGLGLPVPEEASLVLGGYLMYVRADLAGDPPFPALSWPVARMMGTACVAILAGDLTVYALGRRWGRTWMQHRWVQWVFSKQNRDRIDRFYERFGLWAVFVSRFVAGVRVGSFFLAGASGLRLRTFLLMDGLGALLSAPLSVWLAYHFGKEIDLTLHWLSHLVKSFAMGIALAALLTLWWQIRRGRRPVNPAEPPAGASS